MNNKEFDKEINLKIATKHKKEKELEKILNSLPKVELEEIYETISKNRIDESKKELILKISTNLKNEELIHDVLNTLTEEEFNEIKRIIDNNGELQDDYLKLYKFMCVRMYGLVYLFNDKNKVYAIIPNEIMEIMNNTNLESYQKKAKENTQLVDLAYAMLNLYGTVSIGNYISACIKYYKYNKPEDINLSSILLAERNNSIRGIKYNDNFYLVKDEFLDDDSIDIMRKIISKLEDDLIQLDYKDISLKELLKYKDLFYYEETDATIEFKEYLRDNNIEEDIDDLISTIIQTFKKDYNEGIFYLKEIYDDIDIELTEENIDDMLYYINKIINNIAMWGNNGWTNKELALEGVY